MSYVITECCFASSKQQFELKNSNRVAAPTLKLLGHLLLSLEKPC